MRHGVNLRERFKPYAGIDNLGYSASEVRAQMYDPYQGDCKYIVINRQQEKHESMTELHL